MLQLLKNLFASSPQKAPVKLIVGLGNPGKEYDRTRHNVGFFLTDFIADELGALEWKKESKFKGEVATTMVQGEKIMFLKPLTYMNLSGEAVRAVLQFFKLEPEDALIIYDDVDIPVGTLRFRDKGSAGTHNGMRSIVQCLGTQEVPRLRIGIAPEKTFPGALSDFVLGKFTEDELAAVHSIEKEALQEVEQFLKN